MTGRATPLGPAGEALRANVRVIRGYGTYTRLSRALLTDCGVYIPPLGLRRIEKGDRRVDVDELVAFAKLVGVTPGQLLVPATDLRRPNSGPRWTPSRTGDG